MGHVRINAKVSNADLSRVIEVDRSRAWVEIEGRGEIVPVLVSGIIDKVLIGVTTLEVLELEVDPVTGKLRERTPLLY
ncbi:hypothetical protein [Vulcanisaeta distributa]|uniref:Aspartyl protease n=1 Tax=Vulcanisaeta distributa (strain DSM 14429 / JCM 11212 / NBRC 100878 / IC-017) TaxID=572478 RepID=E1QSW7_VULDI|nr:hypothetical protein [Vulcanisaeta distributa]ADN50834.1 hypothetical protein Vdis_1448 [Vulcanisaeta distributa DSM 14429]